MEIRVRLHPSLRAELRAAAKSPHGYRQCLASLEAQAKRIVARHGAEITYAAVNALAAPLDETGSAMSAFGATHNGYTHATLRIGGKRGP